MAHLVCLRCARLNCNIHNGLWLLRWWCPGIKFIETVSSGISCSPGMCSESCKECFVGMEGTCNAIAVDDVCWHPAHGGKRYFFASAFKLRGREVRLLSQSCVILSSPQFHGQEQDTEPNAVSPWKGNVRVISKGTHHLVYNGLTRGWIIQYHMSN